MSEAIEPSGAGLTRRLGLASATALVVGEVLGVGIFLTPARMASALGSPFWLLVVWLAMGAVAACGALCFGELAARFPEAGGGYVYLKRAYGPRVAFLFGWMSLLVMDPGLTAALAVGLGDYAANLLDAARIAALDPAGRKAVAVGGIWLVAGANALGVGLGVSLLRVLTALKVGLLALIALWGFGLGRGDWSNLSPFVARREGSGPLAAALVGAFVSAFFSFGGWWDASKVAGEVREPGRTMPRALVLGVAAVTAIYVLVSLVFLYLVPLDEVATEEGFAAQAGVALFGFAGGFVFSAVVVAMVLGSLAGVMLAAPRVYYAMARDGLFLPALARLDPRTGAPTSAVVVQAALASLLALTGSFDQILAYFIFSAVTFLALIVASLFVLRRRGGAPSPFPTPGYPLTPLGFLIPIAVLLVLLAADEPGRSLLGAAVVLAGLPFSWVFTRKREPREGPADPARLAERGAEEAASD